MSHQHTILVVEDNLHLQKSIYLALQARNHRILAASTAQQALGVVRQHHNDLCAILLDAMMPDCTLSEMLRQLALRCDPERVVVMSGYDQRELQFITMTTIPRFLAKPFDLPALYATLEAVCTCAHKHLCLA
jgi:two-component system, OmpR family, KDP operon response regulator KdpE